MYLIYSKSIDGKSATVLARVRLRQDRLVDLQDLFSSNHLSDKAKHFGSRFSFDGRGHIFISHGDRGSRSSAQDLADHARSVIRLNLDGSVPMDNPFVMNKNAMPEIWSFGHRNPQELAYDKVTNRLWGFEHCPHVELSSFVRCTCRPAS